MAGSAGQPRQLGDGAEAERDLRYAAEARREGRFCIVLVSMLSSPQGAGFLFGGQSTCGDI
jgi:hypothetical protein